ncbi:MAG: aminopeptidase P family N-terminal domain-containing protein [Lachnospiraceae bacterium]|nr:aminopeptidase P family N-terminal domain-containing protein [Lachnospiraceae bacterium]
MNLYAERIGTLRDFMRQNNLDVYYVPTADFHGSEYIDEYFKVRTFLSGFTGSAGTLYVTLTEAGLFTDGRYFIQAEQELTGSGITLYRSGMENVPTPEEKLKDLLADGGTLGFDGRLLSYAFLMQLKESLPDTVTIRHDMPFPDELWSDRPALSARPAFRLAECYAGKSTVDKLSEVREAMKKVHPDAIYKNGASERFHKNTDHTADVYLITSLDEIAWLFNLRGNDVVHNPVVLSYAMVTDTKAFLYLNPSVLDADTKKQLENDGIIIHPYNSIYEDVSKLRACPVLLDAKRVNCALVQALPKECTILDATGPILLAKAIKNETEQKNLVAAHIKDGVAVTKFMYWLKKNIGRQHMTETSAADYLLSLREKQEGFLEPSFETIAAYNANAAMMHYSADEETAAVLHPQGFLLVDSGGQYYEGTTDITRTYVLGDIPYEWKQHYTAVLRGMLALSDAKFLYGCRGINLDILARGPLWQMGLDYRCGTGHGVGYLLNVHEAPNGFRWRIVPERNDSCILEEGMVTTNEPGVYVEGSHGIRIENELLCKKGEKNEYGQYMYFETLTMAPIDLDAVLPEEMTAKEREILNNYHKKVYETLLPYMNEEETKWLREATREI